MTEESVKSEMGNMESVLSLMDRVNEVFSYEVWIPSLNRNVMFREINTSQQKRLIKSIIDSPVYNTEFIFTMKKIIEENCVDTTIDVNELTIIDKLMIAMKMRSVSVGDTLEMQIPVGEGTDKQTLKRAVSLENLLKELKDNIKVPQSKEFSGDNGIYTISCGVPTILEEYKLEDEMRNESEGSDINTYKDLRKNVGDVFMGEIAKYIHMISIKDDDKITKITMDDLSFTNRIALIGRIPKRVVEDVIKYIDNVKSEMDKVTLIKVNVGTDEEPEIKEETFAIDGGFFTSS